jgi:hypothetical protein
MNPWAIGIASNMYFINRIKLIPLLTESKTCRRLNFLGLHARFRQFVGFLRDKYHRRASNCLKLALGVGGDVFAESIVGDNGPHRLQPTRSGRADAMVGLVLVPCWR